MLKKKFAVIMLVLALVISGFSPALQTAKVYADEDAAVTDPVGDDTAGEEVETPDPSISGDSSDSDASDEATSDVPENTEGDAASEDVVPADESNGDEVIPASTGDSEEENNDAATNSDSESGESSDAANQEDSSNDNPQDIENDETKEEAEPTIVKEQVKPMDTVKKSAKKAAYDKDAIASWDELQQAINAKESSITIAENLYATETIEINYPVTIKGKDGQTIYQNKREDGEKYDTMFKVTGDGNLTLGKNLTLTGETDCASSGGGGSGNKKVTFKLSGGAFDGGFLRLNDSGVLTQYTESYATEFELDAQGYLTYNGNYIGLGSGDTFECSSAISKEKALQLMKNGTSFVLNGNVNTEDEYGLGYEKTPGANDWQYADYNDGAYAFIQNASYASASNGHFKAVSITDGSSGDQGCDTPDCGTYTEDNFGSGTSIDAPKGFFVQVEQGAKASLEGATLKNFITSREKSETPRFVAPVAVVGGTFNIKSGEITNNIVGYIVNDEKANENANAIKQYVKGAAPNAVRTGGERRNKQAGIDAGGEPGSGITATAGAVIYAGGATGTVSGGSISLNRGDTGGIMATGSNTKVTLEEGTDINNNVGVQFGGGTTTENGAWIVMTGGTISENVAWFGGGAVYSTENGVNWLLGKQSKDARQDGWFTMDGGTIEGNTAFTRGGAILADSDGVSLIKGTFKDNMARMLGGAIYVMGDHPDYTYTVYIAKGYVHENKAVSGGYKGTNPQAPDVTIDDDNLKLSQVLVGPNGCTPVAKLFNGYMTTNSDDTVDGYPGNQKNSTDGTGGGVWLCSYGNTTLDLSNESEFYINENTATGSVRNQPISGPGKGGDDLHKDTKNNGSLVITGIDANDNWVDQNSGEKYTSPDGVTNSVKDTAMRNLINNGTEEGNDMPEGYDPASYDGVDFYGNLSRRGGALAADGSFVFGKTQDIAQLFAEMSIEKAWTEGTPKQPIVLKVFVETDDDKVEFAEVRLSEDGTPASELDVVFDEGNYKGRLMLPAFVEKRDDSDKIVDMIPVFDIKVDGSVIDLNSVEDLTALAEAIAGDENRVEFSSEGRKITFEEYIEVDGELVKTDKFQLSPAKISLDELDATIKTVKQKQTDGSEPTVVKASFPELKFNANVTNDKPAEIEKFVNEAVHKNIALDEVFTYDIVAYVKQDADKIVITDTLVDDLEFVSAYKDVKLYDLGKDNNHKPTNDASGAKINDDATVSGGTEIVNEVVEVDGQVLKKVEINDQTLTVTLANLLEFDDDGNYQKNADDNQLLTPLRGHWVRVSFQAQIKKEYQDKINAGTMSLDKLQNVKITKDDVYKPEDSIYPEDENRPTPNVGNKPVESEEDHDGIINTASYAVEVANEAAYRDESNTVTVKPEGPEIEKFVNEAVHKDISLDEVFTYDIVAYITKDAEEVIITDELNDDLDFVGTAEDVEITDLGESNNHKVTNDIKAEPVNDDATVAEEGEAIEGAEANIEDGKLTVTIADAKKVRGHWVKVRFQCRIKEGKTLDELKFVTVVPDEVYEDPISGGDRPAPNVGNKPVESDEEHTGVPNTASYVIKVDNEAKYEDTSNTVTVKPDGPEIEKYINQAVHKDIKLDEVFTYDIIAYITKDAEGVTITDELNDDLQFVGDSESVEVVDLGEENNHKVTNNIKAEKVNEDATVAKEIEEPLFIEGKSVEINDNKLLTVDIPDASSIRGHWIRIRFQCKIKDGKTVDDLKYSTVKPDEVYEDPISGGDRLKPNVGNDPVESDEEHTGVPNTANYVITVDNEAKYKDTSNTVTVKPETEQTDVNVVKKWDEFEDDNTRRPTSITINLLANGEKTGDKLVLTEDDDWKGAFTDLEKFDADGEEITYTVEEESVDYYYYDTDWLDESYVVTNHSRPWIPRIPGTPGNVGEFTVEKTVSGLAEKDKAYDIQVKFTYESGEEYVHEVSLTPGDEPYKFDYVPAGTKVEITELTTGYNMTCKVDGTEKTNFNVKVGESYKVVINNDIPKKPGRKPEAPKSGDENNIALWIGIMVVGILGLLVALRSRIAKKH